MALPHVIPFSPGMSLFVIKINEEIDRLNADPTLTDAQRAVALQAWRQWNIDHPPSPSAMDTLEGGIRAATDFIAPKLANVMVPGSGQVIGGIIAEGKKPGAVTGGTLELTPELMARADAELAATPTDGTLGPDRGFLAWLIHLFFPPLHHAAAAPQSTSGVVTPPPPSYPTQTDPVASPPVATPPREIVSPYRPGNVHVF